MTNDSAGRRRGPSISRRDFLVSSGFIAGLPALLPFPLAPHWAADYPLGLQLYTVRDALGKDFAGTLRQVAGFGYQEVELYDALYERNAREMRRALDRAGLAAPGGHFAFERLERDLERVIADAKALGHRFVIVPSIDDARRTPEGYADLAARFTRIGRALRQRGLRLGYHNHEYDVRPLEGGRSGLEILLDETPPGVFVYELDLYWARAGGADIPSLFRRYRGRFRLVHVKDMAADGSQTDVGAGTTDWAAILKAARRAGVRHWFIEIDDSKDPLAFARVSHRYLRKVSW